MGIGRRYPYNHFLHSFSNVKKCGQCGQTDRKNLASWSFFLYTSHTKGFCKRIWIRQAVTCDNTRNTTRHPNQKIGDLTEIDQDKRDTKCIAANSQC